MASLTERPLTESDRAALEAEARRDGAGAVVSFAGIVRSDEAAGRRVVGLWYEAYAEMAEAGLRALIGAQAPRAVVRVRHRMGFVAAGDMSVLVAAASAHRREAFAAAHAVVEGLKRDVPIWKREHYDDGATAWVRCEAHPASHQEPAHAGV
jgi:molybdopterin synthase catalytic subunit